MIDSKHIETVKFQTYAEKADTEEKRIELCKKYLAHKGIDLNPKPVIVPPTFSYNDTNNLRRVESRVSIDKYMLEVSDKEQYYNYVRKQCIDLLLDELVKNDYVKFETIRDITLDRENLTASLVVCNVIPVVWKDPNNA